MEYYRINTDFDARNDVRTCDVWYEKRMAFTGDYEGLLWKSSSIFNKLHVGDRLFMHHSDLGIVGLGNVAEKWDEQYYTGDQRLLYRTEPYEYRIIVDWLQKYDCRENPLSVHGRLPYRGIWSFVDKEKYDIDKLLTELGRR